VTEADQVEHALLAHVAERHRRAGGYFSGLIVFACQLHVVVILLAECADYRTIPLLRRVSFQDTPTCSLGR
jgi:hypothetical protein